MFMKLENARLSRLGDGETIGGNGVGGGGVYKASVEFAGGNTKLAVEGLRIENARVIFSLVFANPKLV
jgi:hypothetical protein